MKILAIVAIVSVLAMSAAATELDSALIGNLGFYAYEQGELELAEALFLRALAEDSAYEHARFNLATLYHQEGNYDGAIEQLQTLVELRPGNVQYQYDLGVNYIARFREDYLVNDFHAGVAAYEAAAAIDAGFAHVQGNLEVLYNLERFV